MKIKTYRLFYWYTIFHSIWWKNIFVIRFLKQHDLSPLRTVTLKNDVKMTPVQLEEIPDLYITLRLLCFSSCNLKQQYFTWHLICLYFLMRISCYLQFFFLNFAIRYLFLFKIFSIERINIFTGWIKTLSVYFIIRIGLLGLLELVT